MVRIDTLGPTDTEMDPAPVRRRNVPSVNPDLGRAWDSLAGGG